MLHVLSVARSIFCLNGENICFKPLPEEAKGSRVKYAERVRKEKECCRSRI